MGSQNKGSQVISLDFKSPGRSSLINNLLHKVIPTGIIEGFVPEVQRTQNRVALPSSSTNPSLMYLSSEDNNVSIRCECFGTVYLPIVNYSHNFIIARYSWVEVEDNFVDFYLVDEGSIKDTDMVFGKISFTAGGVVNEAVDLSVRTMNPILTIKEIDTFFGVIADTIPHTNYVRVLPGKAVINGKIVEITVPQRVQLPDASGLSNGQERYDLVYVDPYDNTAKSITGVAKPTGSGTAPYFPTEGLTVAIIKRFKMGGNLNTVIGEHIISTKSIFNSYSGKVGNFYCGEYPTSRAEQNSLFKVGGGDAIGTGFDVLRVDKTQVTANKKLVVSDPTGAGADELFKLQGLGNNAITVNKAGGITNTVDISGNPIMLELKNIHANGGSEIRLVTKNGSHYARLVMQSDNNFVMSSSACLSLSASPGNWASIGGAFLYISTTSGAEIISTVDSTSITTGALRVGGGVGIAKNLNVGGTLTSNNLKVAGSTELSYIDIPVVSGNTTNRIWYVSHGFLPTPNSAQVLTFPLGLTNPSLIHSVQISYSVSRAGVVGGEARRMLSPDYFTWYVDNDTNYNLVIRISWPDLDSPLKAMEGKQAQALIIRTSSGSW